MSMKLFQELNGDFTRVVQFQADIITRAEEWRDVAKSRQGINRDGAIALESIVPGCLFKKTPVASYTEAVSRTNYDFALESSDNIIVRAAQAVIQAFKDFIGRLWGWFKEKFMDKKTVNPDASIEIIEKESTKDLYEYFDKYPEIIDKWMSENSVDMQLHAGLKGGRLLASYYHTLMMQALKGATTKNIEAIVHNGFVTVDVKEIKDLIFSFNVYIDKLQEKVKEYKVEIIRDPKIVAGVDATLQAIRDKHIDMASSIGGKKRGPAVLPMVQKTIEAGKSPVGETAAVQKVFEGYKKFADFYDHKTSMELGKYSIDDLSKQCDELTEKAKVAIDITPVIPIVQNALREAMLMMMIIRDITNQCDAYAKAMTNGLLTQHRTTLLMLAELKKSPRAEPGDINGMAKTEKRLNEEIDDLERALQGK